MSDGYLWLAVLVGVVAGFFAVIHFAEKNKIKPEDGRGLVILGVIFGGVVGVGWAAKVGSLLGGELSVTVSVLVSLSSGLAVIVGMGLIPISIALVWCLIQAVYAGSSEICDGMFKVTEWLTGSAKVVPILIQLEAETADEALKLAKSLPGVAIDETIGTVPAQNNSYYFSGTGTQPLKHAKLVNVYPKSMGVSATADAK